MSPVGAIFFAVPSQNGDKYVTSPPPPQSLNLSRIVFSHLKLKREPHSFASRNTRCISVRLSASPHFKVLNATLNRAMSLAKSILS